MNIAIYLIIGLVSGICGGFFGLGGGAILIPALVFFLGFTQHQAQGTTLAILVPPIGLLAAIRYWQGGNVKLDVASFICLGFFLGGWIGAHFAHQISDIILKKSFGFFLLFISIKMIFTKG